MEIYAFGYRDDFGNYHGDFAISVYQANDLSNILEQYPPHCIIPSTANFVHILIDSTPNLNLPVAQYTFEDPSCNSDH